MLASAFAAAPAAAQNMAILQRLQQMNAAAPQPAAEPLRAAILATATARPPEGCTPRGVVAGAAAPVTGDLAVVQAILAGQLRNGWIVYATLDGCGSAEQRYLIVQRADDALLAVHVNEGRSYTTPSIMRDTGSHAAIAAFTKVRAIDPACDGGDMRMGATRILSQSDDLGPDVLGSRYTGSWAEMWRFHTCGRTFDVPVNFRTDGDGGAYTQVDATKVELVAQP